MKAIRYHKFGSPEVLEIEEVSLPSIEDKDLLIEVHATTVNSGDCHLRSGKPFAARLYAGPITPREKILGSTYSGKVAKVGSKVKQFKVGDQVFGSLGSKSGSHAEFIKVAETSIITLKPDFLTHEEAASLVFGSLSARFFLEKAGLDKKKRILVIGAAGGVGSYAVQYASIKGNHVTGMCREESVDYVKSLGASSTIDYRKESLNDYVDKFDIIFDLVGKEKLSLIKKALSERGTYITTAARSDVIFKQNFNKEHKKKYMFALDGSTVTDINHILDMVTDDGYKPLIDQIYKMDDIRDAYHHVETQRKKGAVVVNLKS